MSPLEADKQLLVTESEINRAQLVDDITRMKVAVGTLSESAKLIAATASSAALLVTVLLPGRNADAQPSKLKTLLRSAELITTFWLTLRKMIDRHPDK